MRYAKRYAGDLLLGYERARANGYGRSYGCFKRTASKLLRPGKKRRKRKNKPSQRAEYPGQKVQIDVRFVPIYCVADGGKYYQFMAKDECTRWTYREIYDEHSSVSAKDFLTCRGMRSHIEVLDLYRGVMWQARLSVTLRRTVDVHYVLLTTVEVG